MILINSNSNKKSNKIVTEFFITCRKLSIPLDFIAKSYFVVWKIIRLNLTYYFVVKTPNKGTLQQILYNRASETDFKDFMNLFKKI